MIPTVHHTAPPSSRVAARHPGLRPPAFHMLAFASLLVMAFALLLAPAAAAKEAQIKAMQAPGSRVSVELPDAFKPSPLFSGFMEIISSAAVVILEMPAEAYDQVKAGFTDDALAGKGITDVKRPKLARTDDHVFLTGSQSHPRGEFAKYVLVLHDDKNTAVVSFNVPKVSLEEASIKEATVLHAMETAKLADEAAPLQDLFELTHTGPFKPAGRALGTTRIYRDEADKGTKADANIIVIAPSINRLPVWNIEEFSSQALQSLNGIKDATVVSKAAKTVDGLKGHQVTATATRGDAATPVTVRQLILLPADGGYFRLVAITKTADDARLVPEIEALFNGFKAKPIPDPK